MYKPFLLAVEMNIEFWAVFVSFLSAVFRNDDSLVRLLFQLETVSLKQS